VFFIYLLLIMAMLHVEGFDAGATFHPKAAPASVFKE
jgi:hypothetical protein